MKLTKAQRYALESMPYGLQEASEQSLRADGIGNATLRSLYAAGLIDSANYANGRYWRITDLGRSALTQEGERREP